MGKNYFIFAAALMALASCSSDDILGGAQTGGNETSEAIQFAGETGKITRATSNTGTVANMLDHQFMIYGVKAVTGVEGKTYGDVFKNYILWDATANSTTTNTNGWEYVGKTGQKYGSDDSENSQSKLTSDQTIKFWDYSSANYHFVAGSPVSAFKYKTSDKGDIKSATITGLEGHINPNKVDENGTWEAKAEPSPVYVAEPKIVAKADYNKPVQFNFVRQQSKVRVGIYETIPGYKITDIKFYKQGDNNTLELDNANEGNIILTSTADNYFVGAKNATGTITYDWTKPSYTFAYDDGQDTQNGQPSTKLTKSKNWYGGQLLRVTDDKTLATTSTESNKSKLYGIDKDMESTGYFTVIPTPSETEASAILIKCDYTLTSEDGSKEEIKVTGATAAIPAAFCKWETNTQYTYLFKISQNTNGTTGADQPKPGLFPITFDAVVAEVKDANKQGTITTVTTPSITTYQEGSVTDNGVEYKVNKAIYATVTESTTGNVQELKSDGTSVGSVKVYKLNQERNEADLQISGIINTELTAEHSQNAIVGSSNVTAGTVKLEKDKYLLFTPTAEGWYAIQYLSTAAENNNPAAYTYKIVHVAANTGE